VRTPQEVRREAEECSRLAVKVLRTLLASVIYWLLEIDGVLTPSKTLEAMLRLPPDEDTSCDNS
jgi:hypothetical protein